MRSTMRPRRNPIAVARRTPLGIETNTGFAVVVSSCDGSVALWSFETQTLKPLESDLATLIGALT